MCIINLKTYIKNVLTKFLDLKAKVLHENLFIRDKEYGRTILQNSYGKISPAMEVKQASG